MEIIIANIAEFVSWLWIRRRNFYFQMENFSFYSGNIRQILNPVIVEYRCQLIIV